MTTVRLRYVQAWVDKRTGQVFRYFRRPGYKRVPLPGLPGSPAFNRAYESALAGEPAQIGARRSKPGSVAAAVAAYLDSVAHFGSRAPGTQIQQRTILQRFRDSYGHMPIDQLPPRFITAMLTKLKPHAARNWFKTIRAFLQFCVDSQLIERDPTAGMKAPKVPKSSGHHSWSEEEISRFEAAHPVGSKPRLALALGLYTAQRRGDVIRMGRQHIRNGLLYVTQEKTGVELVIPVHGDLRAILDATPSEHLTFLVTRRGDPYGGSDFSEWFRAQCDVAGLPKECVFHGLRKAACRRLAEAGCSANEIASISGHATLHEIARYTRAVDQARMARNAMARRIRNDE